MGRQAGCVGGKSVWSAFCLTGPDCNLVSSRARFDRSWGRDRPNSRSLIHRLLPEQAGGGEPSQPGTCSMLAVIIGTVTSILTGLLGSGLGWLLHSHFSGTQLEMELAASRNQKVKEKSSRQEAENGRTAELMARLAELTTGVAAEVGKHSGNIEANNAELASAKAGDAGAVVAAVKKILTANQQMQQELQVAETRL